MCVHTSTAVQSVAPHARAHSHTNSHRARKLLIYGGGYVNVVIAVTAAWPLGTSTHAELSIDCRDLYSVSM